MVEFADGQGFKTSDKDTAIAVGLKKDSDLKDKINKILAGISEDERQEIMNKRSTSRIRKIVVIDKKFK